MAIRSDYKAVDKAEFLREWLWLMDMSFRELCDLQKHYEGRGGVRYRGYDGEFVGERNDNVSSFYNFSCKIGFL